MKQHAWVHSYPSIVTVCDREGIIVEMNEASIKSFAADGGEKLIGTNALDCHPEPARSKMAEMLKTGEPNTYTTEKNGVKNLIHQSPWYQDGKFAGLVEIIIVLPPDMPHYKRG